MKPEEINNLYNSPFGEIGLSGGFFDGFNVFKWIESLPWSRSKKLILKCASEQGDSRAVDYMYKCKCCMYK